MDSNLIVPIGKYRGQPVDVLLSDEGYVQWLQNQPWLKDNHPILYQVIVNRGVSDDSDTPEHNAMQAKFLNERYILAWSALFHPRDTAISEFVRECMRCTNSDFAVRVLAEKTERSIRVRSNGETIQLEWPRKYKIVSFEDIKGADVTVSESGLRYGQEKNIELKPVVGDDYPKVLRQCKRSNSTCLIGRHVESSVVSVDQIKSIFKMSGVTVILESEIESIEPYVDDCVYILINESIDAFKSIGNIQAERIAVCLERLL